MDNNLKKFKINFQRFGADDGATGEGNSDPGAGDEKTTYTAEEVADLIQREADKRVTSALKKAELANNKKIAEAKRLAEMSEADRQNEKIRQLEAELQERAREISIRENTITLQAEMSKRNIPAELAQFLVSDDADTMFDNLKLFDGVLKKLINSEVEKRITGTTPKSGNMKSTESMTKDKFKNLSLSAQQEIFETNKDLYNAMTN